MQKYFQKHRQRLLGGYMKLIGLILCPLKPYKYSDNEGSC